MEHEVGVKNASLIQRRRFNPMYVLLFSMVLSFVSLRFMESNILYIPMSMLLGLINTYLLNHTVNKWTEVD